MDESKKDFKTPMSPEKIYRIMLTLTFVVAGIYSYRCLSCCFCDYDFRNEENEGGC